MIESLKPQDYKNARDIPRRIVINEDGFEIRIRRSDTEFCIVEEMYVDGIMIDFFDLGLIKDIEPEKAPPCGCGHRAFVPKPPTTEILEKLNISKDEYDILMNILVKHMDYGLCKRCR